MDAIATMTSKGQVTIPHAIRREMGLDAGTQLTFVLEDGELRVTLVQRPTWADLWRIAQTAPRPAKPVDIKAAIRAEVLQRLPR